MGSKSSKSIRGTGKGKVKSGAAAGAGGEVRTGQVVTKKFKKKELDNRLSLAGKTGSLSLSAARLAVLPPAVVSLTQLRKLDVSHNLLEDLPDLSPLVKVKTVVLDHNLLTVLPDSVCLLPALQTLSVSHNRLTDLPPTLPPKLQNLSVTHNALAVVPPSVGSAVSLMTLDLSNNAITGFSPVLMGLSKLAELNLSHNHIPNLAPITDFSPLVSLQILDLSHNRLIASSATLPASLFTDTRAHRITLTGNSIRQREMQELPGFEAFLERRKDRINKGLQADVGGADRLCGLTS